MIVTKVQKQPKVNKVIVIAPQNVPVKPAKIAVTAPRVLNSPDRIRERAYEFFEKRGSNPGHDLQDWFRAERQILAS
jgi:hypothetical protein